jgi:hypothetical protein
MFWKLVRAKKFFPVKENNVTMSRRKMDDQFRASLEIVAELSLPLSAIRLEASMGRCSFLSVDSTPWRKPGQ